MIVPLQGSDRQAGDVDPVPACVSQAHHGFRHGCDVGGEPVRCGSSGAATQAGKLLLTGLEKPAGMASASGRRASRRRPPCKEITVRKAMFYRHRTPAGLLAATLTWATLLISAPAAAQEAHGVIAFGTETGEDNGVAYGFAWNFPAKETALSEAVNACIASGGTNCVQLAWFQDGCGALAMDQHGNAQGKPGMTLEQAEARALRACEAAGGAACDIVGSLCAAPGSEPRTWSGSESVLPAPDAQTTATGPADESLTREERILIQQTLTALGFDAGSADGVFGSKTRAAIRDWQEANGHEATGYVTREQAASLVAFDASPDQEQEPPREAADLPSGDVLIFGPATGPKCAETGQGKECWEELANQPGCYFFNPHFRSKWTWSGACTDGIAVGQGSLEMKGGRLAGEGTGKLVRGKLDGRWVWRLPGISTVAEGPYVDGKQHGRWIYRDFDGRATREANYVNGTETP